MCKCPYNGLVFKKLGHLPRVMCKKRESPNLGSLNSRGPKSRLFILVILSRKESSSTHCTRILVVVIIIAMHDHLWIRH